MRIHDRACCTRNSSVASGDRVGEGKIAGFQIEFDFLRCAENARSLVVEFSFPSRDYNRGQAVPSEIYAGQSHVHQFIVTTNYRQINRSESCWEEAVQRSEEADQGCS